MSTTKSPDKVKKKSKPDPEQSAKATRETIESVVIAIILAFLFRSFEAEAFVIPTGSMAPTLQGRHKDTFCPECGYQYRTGASDETHDQVSATVCPICRHVHVLDPYRNWNEASFTGDRILVSKFAYQIGDPERWDAIVFKFPGNAKQNYIKRLIGLPEEKIRIRHGDIFIQGKGDTDYHIARKPPQKQVAMLQLVDDTDFLAPSLVEAKWPSRWQRWQLPGGGKPADWKMTVDGRSFSTDGQGDEAWLRYRHIPPRGGDWGQLGSQQLPDELTGLSPEEFTSRRQCLITDFYTYNTHLNMDRARFKYLGDNAPVADFKSEVAQASLDSPGTLQIFERVLGRHWVGDLAVEATAQVTSSEGELLLDLIEGGVHYDCRIDIATGIAKLEIDRGATKFVDKLGEEVQFPTAQTTVRGPGTYQLRLANCDDQLMLWVNGSHVKFDGPTTYANRPNCAPSWQADDPGDMAPAGVGSKNAAVTFSSLRILRDVYYIASRGNLAYDYNASEDMNEVFSDPTTWDKTSLFASRAQIDFETAADQFFPLGDNSPESQDARSWGDHSRSVPRDRYYPNEEPYYAPPYVRRELLIGKALLIYWPHAWNRPVMFTPNVKRMGVIR